MPEPDAQGVMGIVAQSEKRFSSPFSRKKIFVGLSGRFYAKIGIVGVQRSDSRQRSVIRGLEGKVMRERKEGRRRLACHFACAVQGAILQRVRIPSGNCRSSR